MGAAASAKGFPGFPSGNVATPISSPREKDVGLFHAQTAPPDKPLNATVAGTLP